MLFYVGHNVTQHSVLLQDGKGRFYTVKVNGGQRVVVSRERAPLLADYDIRVIELPHLEMHQHQGGGELWLLDTERGKDVREGGTDNKGFQYEPGWTTLCLVQAGEEATDMARIVPAKLLPGWEWICYEDGSGHLADMDGNIHISYDSCSPMFIEYRFANFPSKSGNRWDRYEPADREKFRNFVEEFLKKKMGL